METARAEIDIARPPAEVWAVVGEFGGLTTWMPGVTSCRVEGQDRIVEALGMTITEHLVDKDDSGHSLTYAIVAGAPVEHHRAVVSVSPGDGGSHVAWTVEAGPKGVAGLMATTYQAALDALKEQLER
ncbi:MAG TPA: SRPBCC family protein [Acidimicrobiales bacterium]|nr:SRPBCC family protein [Acidimicrobiales bacterium]